MTTEDSVVCQGAVVCRSVFSTSQSVLCGVLRVMGLSAVGLCSVLLSPSSVVC